MSLKATYLENMKVPLKMHTQTDSKRLLPHQRMTHQAHITAKMSKGNITAAIFDVGALFTGSVERGASRAVLHTALCRDCLLQPMSQMALIKLHQSIKV